MTADLPDTFETRQGRALARAWNAGDTTAYDQLARYTEEELALSESLRATKLFKELLAAEARGDQAEHDRLLNEMKTTCPPRLITQTLAAATMQAGMAQGWLPAAQHAQLTGWIAELGMGAEIQAMVASIQPR
jgi:hypothetical protein